MILLVIIIRSFLKKLFYLFSFEDEEDRGRACGIEEGSGTPRGEKESPVSRGGAGPAEEEAEGAPLCPGGAS